MREGRSLAWKALAVVVILNIVFCLLPAMQLFSGSDDSDEVVMTSLVVRSGNAVFSRSLNESQFALVAMDIPDGINAEVIDMELDQNLSTVLEDRFGPGLSLEMTLQYTLNRTVQKLRIDVPPVENTTGPIMGNRSRPADQWIIPDPSPAQRSHLHDLKEVWLERISMVAPGILDMNLKPLVILDRPDIAPLVNRTPAHPGAQANPENANPGMMMEISRMFPGSSNLSDPDLSNPFAMNVSIIEYRADREMNVSMINDARIVFIRQTRTVTINTGSTPLEYLAGGLVAIELVLTLAGVASVAYWLLSRRPWLRYRLGARRCRNRRLLLMVERVSSELGLVAPDMMICSGSGQCFVMGLDPVLYLSADMIRALSSSELRAVLRHEVSHILNGDNLVAPLLGALRIIFCYNPLVHGLAGEIIDSMEKLADVPNLANVSREREYLSALLKVHDLRKTRVDFSIA